MEELKQCIAEHGSYLGGGILKVDSFINHQVDPPLMMKVGQALAEKFRAAQVTKVLTAEISGIAPAFTTALELGVPVVYARKTRPVTMPPAVFVAQAPSHTKGGMTQLMVSPEFLGPGDRVLIIDDFLATGSTIEALAHLVLIARAKLVGVGAVIEKAFEGGRDVVASLDVPVHAVVSLTGMDEDGFTFGD